MSTVLQHVVEDLEKVHVLRVYRVREALRDVVHERVVEHVSEQHSQQPETQTGRTQHRVHEQRDAREPQVAATDGREQTHESDRHETRSHRYERHAERNNERHLIPDARLHVDLHEIRDERVISWNCAHDVDSVRIPKHSSSAERRFRRTVFLLERFGEHLGVWRAVENEPADNSDRHADRNTTRFTTKSPAFDAPW